jgi:hypothetical protein
MLWILGVIGAIMAISFVLTKSIIPPFITNFIKSLYTPNNSLKIIKATYGKNLDSYCGPSPLANDKCGDRDRTLYFQNAIDKQYPERLMTSFNYKTSGGDPIEGKNKNLEIIYSCGNNPPRTFTMGSDDMEIGYHNVRLDIHCP